MVTYFNLVPCKGFVWNQSFINCTTRPRRYIAPSSIIHISFFITLYLHSPIFSLVLFTGIVGKQLAKKYMLLKCTLGCTEGALLGCTKPESLRTKWYVLPKTKICRIITEVFHFHATYFILHFLLKTFFKTVAEPLNLLTVHHGLTFSGALKKALMVLEGISYEKQYFANIFLSP